MEKTGFFAVLDNIRRNLLLLVSAFAALCLFLKPSTVWVLMIFAVFGIVVMFAALGMTVPPRMSTGSSGVFTVVFPLLLAAAGFQLFRTTWLPSGMVAAVARKLHLTSEMLLSVMGLAGGAVGFYALHIFACWIIAWINMGRKQLAVQSRHEICGNLKRNWFFPVSAMAFFCLDTAFTVEYAAGLLVALPVSVVVATQIPSIRKHISSSPGVLQVGSFLTALGICLAGYDSCPKMLKYVLMTEGKTDVVLPASVNVAAGILALAAVFSVWFFCLVFWGKLGKALSDSGLFEDISRAERILYALLLGASLLVMVLSFARTDAFYGTEYEFDIIYTSDSPSLVKDNVYLMLTHLQNDLRQPLFAVFAAPFAGIPYLLGRMLGGNASVSAVLINSVQIAMMLAANFMLTKIMKLSPVKRMCFMLLSCCTYTHLLFILMMEQYAVAYFWTIFCIYLMSEKHSSAQMAMWGAGGTLLTSMVLLPFLPGKSPIREFKAWFLEIVKYGCTFVAVLLAFCRLDVILNLTSKTALLGSFTGDSLTLADKLYQYTAFLCSCFAAPDAGVNMTAAEHMSWQLNPVTGISTVGVLILLLAVVSVVVNREKRSTLLAAGWAGFSVIMLVGLGWGTIENGLILYSLYFGWAFLVLLFQLAEKIETKWNVTFLLPAAAAGSSAVLLAVNIPAVLEMIRFAAAYFPV